MNPLTSIVPIQSKNSPISKLSLFTSTTHMGSSIDLVPAIVLAPVAILASAIGLAPAMVLAWTLVLSSVTAVFSIPAAQAALPTSTKSLHCQLSKIDLSKPAQDPIEIQRFCTGLQKNTPSILKYGVVPFGKKFQGVNTWSLVIQNAYPQIHYRLLSFEEPFLSVRINHRLETDYDIDFHNHRLSCRVNRVACRKTVGTSAPTGRGLPMGGTLGAKDPQPEADLFSKQLDAGTSDDNFYQSAQAIDNEVLKKPDVKSEEL